MEKKHQDILKQLRQNFLDDLDVFNGIVLPLTTEYILKEEDVESIKKGKTKRERAKILLDLLPKFVLIQYSLFDNCRLFNSFKMIFSFRRGSHAFDIFHQSLRHQYFWLSDEIDKLLETKTSGISITDTPFIYNMQPVSPLTVTREEMVRKFFLCSG